MKKQQQAIMALGLITGLCLTGCQPGPALVRETPAVKASATHTPEPASPVPPTQVALTTTTPSCSEVEGLLQQSSYTGLVYGQEIPYHIYLPPCYGLRTANYPVVYMLHGYPYDQDHWPDLGILEAYESGFALDARPQIIFVFPLAPEPLFTRTDGGVGSYEQEFIEGLLAAIEEQYRVAREPDQRVLAGVSRGGVWALEIGMRNANLFQHVFAVSPALVYNQPRARFDPFQIAQENPLKPQTLFISAAENESPFREEIERFAATLEAEGIERTFLLHPGNHNDATWRAIMGDVLVLILASLAG